MALGDAGLVGRAGCGLLRMMLGHVCAALVGRRDASLGVGGSRGGQLDRALTVLPWRTVQVIARDPLGV